MADEKSSILNDAVKAVPAVVSGAANFIGNLFNNKSNAKENQKARDFAWDMYDQQREDANIAWEKTNAYNDPSAQMARLKNAGLNPNLVYGNGADAQSKGQPQMPSGQSFRGVPQRWDLGSIAQNALMTQQALANIAKTKAETRALDVTTAGRDFDNQVKQRIGVEAYHMEFNTKYNKLSQEQKKELTEYQLFLDSSGIRDSMAKGKGTIGSRAYLAKKAGYDQAVIDLSSAKKRGDILGAEKIIKDYEANLAKQGMDPKSPWYLKTILSLGTKAGLDMDSYIK